MCCDEKCFGIIRVETGSLVFGVFSAVIWALNILVCVIMLVLVNVFNDKLYIIRYSDFDLFNAVTGSLVAVGLLNFFFAVLLCDGINKRNAAHIRAYFIYGIVTTVMACLGVVIAGIVSSIALVTLGIPIVIYCFILHMINLTIQQITGGQVYGFSHRLLVESQSVQLA